MSSVNQPILDFKSASIHAVRLVLQSSDTSALIEALQSRLRAAGDFFDGEPVVIDALALEQAPDWQALAYVLTRHGMPFVGIAARPELHDSIRTAGYATIRLPVAREGLAPPAGSIHRDPIASAPPASPATPDPGPAIEASRSAPFAGSAMSSTADANPVDNLAAAAQRADASSGAVPVAGNGYRPTLLVDRSLRSGQKIYARDSDLIVVGVVNAGAEVIADGNIHVYGPLRGKAMAGARGDEEARIFTTCLEAELVAVAGVYRVIETALPDNVRERPATVRLHAGGLRIEPIEA